MKKGQLLLARPHSGVCGFNIFTFLTMSNLNHQRKLAS
jgi:hypothetical protein